MSLKDTRKCPFRTPARSRTNNKNRMGSLPELENALEGKQNDLALIKQEFSDPSGAEGDPKPLLMPRLQLVATAAAGVSQHVALRFFAPGGG